MNQRLTSLCNFSFRSLFSETAAASLVFSARGGSCACLTQCCLDFTLKNILSSFCLGFCCFFDGVFCGIFFHTISLKAFTIPTQETKSVKRRMILQIHVTGKANGKATFPLAGRNKSRTKAVPKVIPSSFSL